MSALERPRLRPCLAASPEDHSGRQYVLWDQRRLSAAALRLSAAELRWLDLLDGTRTLRDVQFEAMRQAGGRLVPLAAVTRLVGELDQALFLEGGRFAEVVNGPVRPPACVGTYEAEPGALRLQLRGLFTGPNGPGLPDEPRPEDGLRAALVPHIDYGRGGHSFAFAFKEVYERTAASLFVIVGTSHLSRHRFTLTRKHFQTPLGIVPTDQEYIDRLAARYGEGLFDDEVQAHLPEWSIELEVVFLQYLYEGKRPIRIVPLVVGSFHDCVLSGREPRECDDVSRMIEALRGAERDAPEPICYLISGDLAHIGPKFDDPLPVHPAWLAHSQRQDRALLARAQAGDPAGYFRAIAEERDERRICGLPPTYTVLEAVRPSGGKLLHYEQYVHPRGFESVSFAGAAFYR